MPEFLIILKDYFKVSTNKIYASKHWQERYKIKKDYLQWFAIYQSKFPKYQEKVNLDFEFHFKSKCYDSSNCSFMGKMIEDCLVHYGILKNDTIKYVGRVSYQSLKNNEDLCVLSITYCN